MIKSYSVLSLFLFLFHSINGQNLIPNSSFEHINYCEANIPCSPAAWYSVSDIPFGYENDLGKSIHGNRSMAFLIASQEEIRSYWQTMLLCRLERGREYFLSFNVLPFKGNFNPDYFGIYFIDSIIRSTNDTIIRIKDNYLTWTITHLKNGWLKVTSVFKASGEEKFLLMGNFSTLSNTNILETLRVKPKFIGYYIDDISINPKEKGIKICPEYKLQIDSLFTRNIRHKKNLQIPKFFSSIPTEGFATFKKKDTLHLGNIHFNFDSDILLNTKELDNYFKTISKNSISAISIIGYTDSIGNKEYNQGLSERRALTVKKYLIESLGQKDSIIFTRGKGISTENELFYLNRKVEVIISKSN